MATDVVPILDIGNLLGKPKNRVYRVGVELEGGWTKLPPGIRLEHDGSVFRENAALLAQFPPNRHSGEIPIGAVQPGALYRFMKKYYPHKVDASCGMHVHMSFHSLRHYAHLMAPTYQETMLAFLGQWAKEEGFDPKHHIWGRLAGKSIYCQKAFWPDLQVGYRQKDHDQHRPGHRYTCVNYCGRQHTIEIRVLPMMDSVDQAIRAVKTVINITNACLLLLAGKKEGSFKNKVELAGAEIEEFFHEEFL